MASVRQPLLSLLLLLLSSVLKGTHAFHFPTSRTTNTKLSTKSTPSSCPSTSNNRHHHQLSMTTYSCPNETTKQIYNIPNSGWKSPQWNWGSAQGTGHDCALICRKAWSDPADRKKLVESLLNPVEFKGTHPESEVSFEEIKLILGLAWQNGRWDGSDGGPNGYSSVLNTMANAHRYENEDEVLSALNFIEDVAAKYESIYRNAEELKRMKSIVNDVKRHHMEKEEVFMARRTCAGLVLDAMNFVQNGL